MIGVRGCRQGLSYGCAVRRHHKRRRDLGNSSLRLKIGFNVPFRAAVIDEVPRDPQDLVNKYFVGMWDEEYRKVCSREVK